MKDYVDGSIMKMKDAKACVQDNGVDYHFGSESNKTEFQARPDPYRKLASADFRFHMNQALAQYFLLQEQLANDATTSVEEASAALSSILEHAGQLTPDMSEADLKSYKACIAGARDAASRMAAMNEPAIDDVRIAFWPLSENMIAYATAFNKGRADGTPLFVMHCPMARDNKGASWLQRSDKTANPYFGSSMLECGKLEDKQLFKCMVMAEDDVDPLVSAEYRGNTCFFCCQKCIKKFSANPEQYLRRSLDASNPEPVK